MTPAKFATAHMRVSLKAGNVVQVLPNYPLDGQCATVEVARIESLIYSDDELLELKDYPGPLVKGVTHKKTVIEYCENKLRNVPKSVGDIDSYILMWELLILLLRQNGVCIYTIHFCKL